jgi:hypothetical protein
MNYILNFFNNKDITIMYYYQSFNNTLNRLVESKITNNINIYLSSIHFGVTFDGKPYIHLNNNTPDNQDKLWKEIKYINTIRPNIHFYAMIGGAGGAFNTLFYNFNVYYKLLFNFIKFYNIMGIDLDIEETTSINNIKMLIKRLKSDFGNNFIISMAPIANSMINDEPSMAGFIYKDLFKSDEGKLIDWFNVQCYGCYTEETFNKIISNGYPIDKIVIGMLGDEFTNENVMIAINKFNNFYKKNKVKGVILWEYGDSNIDVIKWGEEFKN